MPIKHTFLLISPHIMTETQYYIQTKWLLSDIVFNCKIDSFFIKLEKKM
jgi:hypothetical protein